MKKSIVILCISLAVITLFLTACQSPEVYTPTGEFYVKTSPANGDAGVSDVISLEAEYKTYEGKGDITVPMTVGFGHLPGTRDYEDDVQDTFYVEYQLYAWGEVDDVPEWEKKVGYSDSWYDSKYDSTEQKNPPTLIIARYGEFYPLYKETVEFVFPADVEKGYVKISISIVIDGEIVSRFGDLRFDFERVDGVLTLKP